MVHFTNITFDDNWVYADAYDSDNKVSGKVKINRTTEQFYTNCKYKNLFHKAFLHVLVDVEDGKIKQNSERTVAWG